MNPFQFPSLYVMMYMYACTKINHTFSTPCISILISSSALKGEHPFLSPSSAFFFFFYCESSVLLLVRLLIQPLLLSTLLDKPTCAAPALLDLFHRAIWNSWPIRFRHSNDPLGLTCSTTLLALLISFDNWSAISCFFLAHDACPLSSNLIDMKESGECL